MTAAEHRPSTEELIRDAAEMQRLLDAASRQFNKFVTRLEISLGQPEAGQGGVDRE